MGSHCGLLIATKVDEKLLTSFKKRRLQRYSGSSDTGIRACEKVKLLLITTHDKASTLPLKSRKGWLEKHFVILQIKLDVNRK